MGEMQIIKNGVSLTIHRDGDMTVERVKRCDECDTDQTLANGHSVMHFGEEILWICALCRTPK